MQKLTKIMVLAMLLGAAFAGCGGGENPGAIAEAPDAAGPRDDQVGVGVGGRDASAPPDAADGSAVAADADADADSGPPFECPDDAGTEPPTALWCTGLYGSWSQKTIAPGIRPYEPAVTLWSDGAEKHRFVLLPEGAKIDTSNQDEWQFPVGTKFWKEFVLGGQRIETRFFWKVGPTSWARTTYRWSADGASATRLDAGESLGDPGAGGYEVPSVSRCDQCHAGSADRILGFEAVGLGLAGATGVTLAALVAEGRLTAPPSQTALVIPGGAAVAPAFGWLHANCGTSCHNASPAASCAYAGLHLQLGYAELAAGAAVADLETYVTTVNVPASYVVTSGSMRIAPHDVGDSAVYGLAAQRTATGVGQMPPIDSHVVDPTGVGYLETWIGSLPP